MRPRGDFIWCLNADDGRYAVVHLAHVHMRHFRTHGVQSRVCGPEGNETPTKKRTLEKKNNDNPNPGFRSMKFLDEHFRNVHMESK